MVANMDWPQLLRELRARGLTQAQIATRVGSSQSVISDLLRGEIKSPSFELGAAIVQLHRETAEAA